MKKRLTSFFLVLALSFSLSLSAFAVDDNSYYSFSPVSDSSLNPVMSVASSVDGWSDTDRTLLKSIERALTRVAPDTLLSYIDSILSDVKALRSMVIDIRNDTDYLSNINNNSNHILSALEGLTSGGLATESTLKTGLLRLCGSVFIPL